MCDFRTKIFIFFVIVVYDSMTVIKYKQFFPCYATLIYFVTTQNLP